MLATQEDVTIDLLENPRPGVPFTLVHEEGGVRTGEEGICVWIRGSAAEFAADTLVRYRDGPQAGSKGALLCGTVESAAQVMRVLQAVPIYDRHRRPVRDRAVAQVRELARIGRLEVARRRQLEAQKPDRLEDLQAQAKFETELKHAQQAQKGRRFADVERVVSGTTVVLARDDRMVETHRAVVDVPEGYTVYVPAPIGGEDIRLQGPACLIRRAGAKLPLACWDICRS